MSDKGTSFDITKVREELKKVIVRIYMENPKKGMKNHSLCKNIFALFSFVLCGKKR